MMYRRIFERVVVGIFIIESDCLTIIDFNRAMCNILNYNPENIIGSPITKFSDESPKIEEKIRELVAGHIIDPLVIELKKSNGERVKVVFIISTFEPKHLYICTFMPIDWLSNYFVKSRENQEIEKRAISKLDDEIDFRKDFIMTAAHELRTPLQPILGYLHLLLDDPLAFELKGDAQRMLRICLDNVERERYIIERMLEISLLYSGKFQIKPTSVILRPLVTEIIEKGEYEREADISNEIPEASSITADRDCLHSILESLISNAVQFNKPPKRVWVTYSFSEQFHQLSVKDNGVGIDKNSIPFIFEPFHLADGAKLSRGYKRLGLALSIANKYVKLHGGDIQVESEVGSGTTFTVRFPKDVIV